MIVISPGHHPVADKFWKEKLGGRLNGARVLGEAQAKYLTPLFEQKYDMLITYASDMDFEIPDSVKRIAVMWHFNFPKVEAFRLWQKVNLKLKGYYVDYFSNDQDVIALVREVGGRIFYLPRFIDTNEYPKFDVKKTIPTLWMGNKWNEFKFEFDNYIKNESPAWISQGQLGLGKTIFNPHLSREATLRLLAKTKEVWAIGICQLEAQYYGCEVVPYRGERLPFYDQNTIKSYLEALLQSI